MSAQILLQRIAIVIKDAQPEVPIFHGEKNVQNQPTSGIPPHGTSYDPNHFQVPRFQRDADEVIRITKVSKVTKITSTTNNPEIGPTAISEAEGRTKGDKTTTTCG